MLKRHQVTVPLTCPGCAAQGSATWEENTPAFLSEGPNSSLEGVSLGFYRRMERSQQGGLEIICDRCGALQPH